MLVIRYYWLRSRIAQHKGRDWVDAKLPKVSPRQMLASSGRVFATAWQPSLHQQAALRSRRLHQILSQLRQLNRRPYSISTLAGERVYAAALAKCLSAICQRSVNPEAALAMIGSQRAAATGISHYLVAWLERRMVDEPRGWTTPLPTRTLQMQANAVDSLPTSGNEAKPTLEVDRETEAVRQARQQWIAQQEEYAQALADQELNSVMMEQHLQFLAIPTAILSACKKNNG